MYEVLFAIRDVVLTNLSGQCRGADSQLGSRFPQVFRLLENLCLGASAVGYRTESMHGAGSPQAQRIMISRQSDMEKKKQLAKNIAGISSAKE